MELNKEQIDRMNYIKSYYPYRIVFGVIMPNGDFDVYAEYTKRKLNKFLRNPECKVFTFN